MNRNGVITTSFKANAKQGVKKSASQQNVPTANFVRRQREQSPEVIQTVVLGDMARANLYQAKIDELSAEAVARAKNYGALIVGLCSGPVCTLAQEGVTRFEILFDFDQDKIRIRNLESEVVPHTLEADLDGQAKQHLEELDDDFAGVLGVILTKIWKAKVQVQRLEYIDDDSYSEYDDDYSDEDDEDDDEDDDEEMSEGDEGEDDEGDEDDDEELDDEEDDEEDDDEDDEDDDGTASNGGVSIVISLF